jgi:ketosteroid isomerase-like protein
MDGMSADELVATYLRAMSTSDVDVAVSLFTDDAVVHSPLYGPTEPRTFYPPAVRRHQRRPLELAGDHAGPRLEKG